MRGLFWNPLLLACSDVRDSQRIQFNGILFSYVVSLGGLLAGGKLLALAGGQAVVLLYPLYRLGNGLCAPKCVTFFPPRQIPSNGNRSGLLRGARARFFLAHGSGRGASFSQRDKRVAWALPPASLSNTVAVHDSLRRAKLAAHALPDN